MFSFQSHNQVLYHLTQLTSAVNPKCTPIPVNVKQKNKFKRTVNDNLTEATKNHIDMSIGKLVMNDVITLLDVKKKNVRVILEQLSTKIFKGNLIENNKWNVSYVSESNFTKNKQKFPCAQFTEPIILPIIYLSPKQYYRTSCTLCVKNPFSYHIQVRSFRTKRSINIEEKPSFISKFKKWFYPTEQDINGDTLEKLKYLFSSSNGSEPNKAKLAFVEGFEAGLKNQKSSISPLQKVLQTILSTILFVLLIWVIVTIVNRKFSSPLGRPEINPETVNVTFNDVKGVDEAKEELNNVIEFLRNPQKFTALGAKLPKGVLLVGPPGTGKTLLARAVANEAGVPFFQTAGPEFDEILVGQGARRVRTLFQVAKLRAPAVIFIDEIDSVGGSRVNTTLHPYANQTINQLLAEMDGFHQNDGVIVLGATNRRNDLDQALMRPGRFDLEIYISPPDINGRKEIFKLYLSRIITQDIDIDVLAQWTMGYTGADIENMVNQAALQAATDDVNCVTMKHLEYARDKVLMGPERRSRQIDEESNRITAFHEAGHALVTYYTNDSLPLCKISIIPRGRSLGHTLYLYEKDVHHTTKSQLLARMDSMMGGRAAEELIFGPDKVTTGAANDFEKATNIAIEMVKRYGMSEKVGFRTYSNSREMKIEGDNELGPNTAELIDDEVKRFLQESYERAKTLLRTHAKELKQLADALIKYETLDAEDIENVVNGKKIRIEMLRNQPSTVDSSKHVLNNPPPTVDPSKHVL